MDQDAFRSLMWRHGLRAVGSRACTQIGGYPVTCRAKAGRIQVMFGTAQSFKELAPALQKAAAGLATIPAELEGKPGFVLTVREFDQFDEAAPAFAAALRAAGAAACDECPLCHKAGCDVVMMHQGIYQPMHDACADEALRRKKGPQVETMGTARGILGALLAALLGAVLAGMLLVASPIFIRLMGLWCLLLPLLIAGGYRLFGGRSFWPGMIATVLFALAGSGGVILEGQAAALGNGFTLQGLAAVWELLCAGGPGMFLYAGARHLGGAALGLILAWRSLRAYHWVSPQNADLAAATRRPYEAAEERAKEEKR